MSDRARKTIEVWKVVTRLQRSLYLAQSDEVRQLLCMHIEQILMDTNNYKGFGFFDEDGNLTIHQIHYGEANNLRHHYYGNPRNPSYITHEARLKLQHGLASPRLAAREGVK